MARLLASKAVAHPNQHKSLRQRSPLGAPYSLRRLSAWIVGGHQKVLKRHIMTMHQLAIGEYRRRWGLTSDYPVVAPNYAAQRREIAKSLRLGGRNRNLTDQP
jgi:hypothetical protein